MSTVKSAGEVAAIITARLGRIRIADGFETDIGAKIFRGRHSISDERVGNGCVSIIEGNDIVLNQLGDRVAQAKIEQRYGLLAYVPMLPDEEPNDAGHRALRDMKKVIYDKNANFDGQVKQVKYVARDIGPRADGVNIVIALLEIGVEYVETLYEP